MWFRLGSGSAHSVILALKRQRQADLSESNLIYKASSGTARTKKPYLKKKGGKEEEKKYMWFMCLFGSRASGSQRTTSGVVNPATLLVETVSLSGPETSQLG